MAGQPSLVVGGRVAGTGPAVWFIRNTSSIDDTLLQLRIALIVGGLVLALVALLAARAVARGVLSPVDVAARAARRIARGDLSVRVPVESDDEFGAWAAEFNEMVDTLQDTILRLEAAQTQNRRFVADVSHELRTPVAALVAEASLLRDHLDAFPTESRRTGELVIHDIGRMRDLVEDLMELSRFDAAGEEVRTQPVDLRRLIREVAATRHPDAVLELPEDRIVIDTDPRRLERILGNLLDNAREHAPVAAAFVLGGSIGRPGQPGHHPRAVRRRVERADPTEHRAARACWIAGTERLRGGGNNPRPVVSVARRPGRERGTCRRSSSGTGDES